MRGKSVPPGTTPLSKRDMVPPLASVRSSTIRLLLVGPTSTIWYHPQPLKIRSGGEMVIHLTSTTANSRRTGVVALCSGRRLNVPPIGQLRSRHRHGGKHPSSYAELSSLYGVMSDEGTG